MEVHVLRVSTESPSDSRRFSTVFRRNSLASGEGRPWAIPTVSVAIVPPDSSVEHSFRRIVGSFMRSSLQVRSPQARLFCSANSARDDLAPLAKVSMDLSTGEQARGQRQ